MIDLVADVCEDLGLPYAIGGSIASMAYGEFRVTSDIDVVVSLRAADVPRFLSRFPASDYYHDQQAAIEAVRTGGQFNILLFKEALKIDVYVAADPVSLSQIERARRLKAPSGRLANFSPPEELIFKKLEYFAFSGSERQLRDISSMLRSSGSDIDHQRVAELAQAHGLADAWQAVLNRIARG
ncbi:MAG TPA: hypothetical protein VF092_14910 [Longimicrobium sp.]